MFVSTPGRPTLTQRDLGTKSCGKGSAPGSDRNQKNTVRDSSIPVSQGLQVTVVFTPHQGNSPCNMHNSSENHNQSSCSYRAKFQWTYLQNSSWAKAQESLWKEFQNMTRVMKFVRLCFLGMSEATPMKSHWCDWLNLSWIIMTLMEMQVWKGNAHTTLTLQNSIGN